MNSEQLAMSSEQLAMSSEQLLCQAYGLTDIFKITLRCAFQAA